MDVVASDCPVENDADDFLEVALSSYRTIEDLSFSRSTVCQFTEFRRRVFHIIHKLIHLKTLERLSW